MSRFLPNVPSPVGPFILAAAVFPAPAPAATAQEVCEWELEETLRLGSIDGEVVLSGVEALELGPEGEIHLTESLVPEIAVFTPEGRPLRTVGGAGEGPGEFEWGAHGVGWVGDTLWAYDGYKTNFFGPDGSPLDQARFATHVEEEGSIFTPGPPLADGSFLGSRLITGWERFAVGSEVMPVRRFARTGEVLDTLALVDWRRRFVEVAWEDGGGVIADHPFHEWRGGSSLHLPVAVAPDGSKVLLIGDVRSGPGQATFDLLSISVSGDTLLRRAIAYEPRSLDVPEQEWWTEAFGGWVAGEFSPDVGTLRVQRSPIVVERRKRAARAAIWFPEHVPPVRQIVAGHDGTIWLLREREERVDRWEVYGAGGELLGRIRIDEGRSSLVPWHPHLRILRATREELWASSIDEFEIPYAHRFRVIRGCE